MIPGDEAAKTFQAKLAHNANELVALIGEWPTDVIVSNYVAPLEKPIPVGPYGTKYVISKALYDEVRVLLGAV